MKKRIFTVLLAIFCVFSAAIFFGRAATAPVEAVKNVSPFALKSNVDLTLNDFTETNEGWDCLFEKSTVTLSERISSFPYAPLTDDGCLIVRTQSAHSGEKITVSKEFSDTLDLSGFTYFTAAVNCSSIEGADYFFNLEMYTQNDSFEAIGQFDPESWTGLFVDISQWENRKEVKEIRISVYYVSGSVPASFFEYYVDSLSLSAKNDVVSSVCFSSEGYSVTDGGSGEVSKNTFNIDADGGDIVIESYGFCYPDLENSNSIRVRFYADGCTGLALMLFDKAGKLTEEIAISASSPNGEYDVRLPIKTRSIGKLELTFKDVKPCTVSIYSITPYSIYEKASTQYGSIDTCIINAKTEELIVRGKLTDGALSGGKSAELYLFAFDPSAKVTPLLLSSSEWIAKTNVSTEDFIFRAGYGKDDDERMFLYRQYAVAVKEDGQFKLLGSPKYVTNPESYSNNPPVSSYKGTGKGVYGSSISFMQEMGVSDTMIKVDIGLFFSVESTGGSKLECGGLTFYYNSEYASAIDTMIKNYKSKKINVNLVVVTSDTGSETLNKLLLHPDAVIGEGYCAYNTSDQTAIMYLRAFTEYLAEKYCADGSVLRIVFGDRVATARTGYNMGKKTLSEFIVEYEKAFRVMYNGVKSYAPDTQIYTYIDDGWDKNLPFDVYTCYDNRIFIDELNRCISDRGNISWGVAQNPYPKGQSDYLSYNDSTLTNTFSTDRIGFGNINVLSDYLKSADITYANQARDLIVIEKTSFSLADELHVTADYVYNSYNALTYGVSAYITDRTCNHNNAMKYIDTNYSMTATSFVPDVLGVASWEGIIKGFSSEELAKKHIAEGAILFNQPEHAGKIKLFDFSTADNGWTRYGFTESITLGSEFADKKGLMSLFLGNIPEGESRGIIKEFVVPYDMTSTPVLHIGVNIASLPSSVTSSEISVILTSGSNVYMRTGQIKEAIWTDIYCDFSNESGIGKVDSITLLFKASENYYDSPQVLLSSIEGLSKEYTDQQLDEMLNGQEDTEFLTDEIKEYLYIALVFVIIVSASVFVWRRTAKKKPTK